MSATKGQWIDGGKIKVADVRITDGLHNGKDDPNHTILDRRGLFVIHAVLLHTGKVLWFCGHVEDGHYALKSYLFDYKNPAAQLASEDFPLHNPSLARGGHKPNNPDSGEFHADLFCSHFVHTHDGKVLVVGGADPDYHIPGGGSHGSVGEKYIYLFDPDDNNGKGKWSTAMKGATPSRLQQGRWYPTAVMLGDGRIAVFSGRRGHGEGGEVGKIAEMVEILTPPTFASTRLATGDITLPLYPGLHLAPNGRIYYTHTTWGLEVDPPKDTVSIAIPNGGTTASWTTHTGVSPPHGIGSPAGVPRREEGMSVLLPPAQKGKILLIGGSEALDANNNRTRVSGNYTHVRHAADALSTAILDTSGANPVWTAGPTLSHSRINVHAVILPDRKVLICGGHNTHKWNAVFPGTPPDQDPVVKNNAQSFVCELYDPENNDLTPAASLNHARMYHAAAVLLPDGTVLIAGGADADPGKLKNARIQNEFTIHNPPPDNFSYPGHAPNPVKAAPNRWEGPLVFWEENPGDIRSQPYNRKDYEIYRPPYLFTPGTQPTIDAITRNGAATTKADYGETLRIRSSQAAAGTEAALIRPGAVTHHTDSEQRYVTLPVSDVSGKELTVTIPNDRNLVPPGYYMLWIIKGGKPCAEAKFILVGSYLAPRLQPPPSIFDCIVATAAMGSADAPEVVFLQGLRRDLNHSGDAGRRFIHAVNALYYSVSPQIARRMRRDSGLSTAIRDITVLPAVKLIDKARRVCGYTRGPHRSAVMVALLTAMGLAGLTLMPLLALLIFARWTREALRQPRESEHE
jgi:hypothetical protein